MRLAIQLLKDHPALSGDKAYNAACAITDGEQFTLEA